MQHTINQNVQSNLSKLERDCRLVYTAIDKMLAEDARARTINGRATRRGLLAFVLSLLGPLMLVASRLLRPPGSGLPRSVYGTPKHTERV